MTLVTLKITEHDNRGTEADPFGYVYFTDGTRLAFAPHTSGLSNPLGLFPVRGWGPVNKNHYEVATAYLTDKGIS